ncbi:Lebocin-4 [Eumeta japonica]|uniref:Lebocin-4 n=1 Tax=Eumeta variegata TaxID=151549 RepID=A0A4C1TIP3_EUMVA|nr:Lebocin-4 [Eumeta japonica]
MIIDVAVSLNIVRPTYRPNIHRPVIIRPTYRPPPSTGPIIRTVRSVNDAHVETPTLPPYIDDIRMDPNRRYARSADPDVEETQFEGEYDVEQNHKSRFVRSLDSPSAKRGGGSHTTSQSSRNTGATHPGYNRRNARSLKEEKEEGLEPIMRSRRTIEPVDLFDVFKPKKRYSPTSSPDRIPIYVNQIHW